MADLSSIIDDILDLKQRILNAYFWGESYSLSKDEVEELAGIIAEHSLLKERLLAAKQIYDQTKGSKRYAAACSELGLNTGKKEPKINSESFFHDYLRLITTGDYELEDFLFKHKEPKPLAKKEAIEKLAKEYGFYESSEEPYKAAYQYLKRILQKKKKN